MSHNRRTLQDMELFVSRRRLTRMNGGISVSIRSAAAPAMDVEFPPSTGHFVIGSIRSGSLVEPNLPQWVRPNKAVGLVAWEGVAAHGD